MSAGVDGVLFDFHSTLVTPGLAADWLERAWARAGRPGAAGDVAAFGDMVEFLDEVWTHARVHDPQNRRDSGPGPHREIFDRTLAGMPGGDPGLTAALYASMTDVWVAYEDAAPVLKSLQQNGIRVGVLSNVGFDIRPVLDREGLADLVDTVVLSFEVGSVKPEPAIFRHALDQLGVTPGRALMVGDSWQDDAGAAAIGVRTLLLPRTEGPTHGLDTVTRLIGL